MDTVPELLILGVPLATLTAATVEQFKRMGLPTQFAGIASWATAGGLTVLHSSMTGQLGTEHVAYYVLSGLVFGLGSQGVFDTIKLMGQRT